MEKELILFLLSFNLKVLIILTSFCVLVMLPKLIYSVFKISFRKKDK